MWLVLLGATIIFAVIYGANAAIFADRMLGDYETAEMILADGGHEQHFSRWKIIRCSLLWPRFLVRDIKFWLQGKE